MSGFIDSVEANILDQDFSGAAASPAIPATWYLALFETAPADDGTGGVETAYTGYARQGVTNNATEFPAATAGAPGVKSNANPVTFPQKTDVGTNTIVAYGWYDAVSAGNLVFFGAVTPNVTLNQNDTPQFAAGQVQMKLGDPGDTY